MSVMRYLGEDAAKVPEAYETQRFGKQEVSQWLKCVLSTSSLGTPKTLVEGSLSNAISSMYLKKHFIKDETVSNVEEMVSFILKEFRIMVTELKWMDYLTKDKVLKKIGNIISVVGYGDAVLDDNFLTEYYQGLSLINKSYLRNILQLNKFSYKTNFDRLKKMKTSERLFPAFLPNAFYDRTINTIYLPAAIIQSYMFSDDQPMFLNYITLGLVIGHELGHAFDALGSQLDQHGTYYIIVWKRLLKRKTLNHCEG